MTEATDVLERALALLKAAPQGGDAAKTATAGAAAAGAPPSSPAAETPPTPATAAPPPPPAGDEEIDALLAELKGLMAEKTTRDRDAALRARLAPIAMDPEQILLLAKARGGTFEIDEAGGARLKLGDATYALDATGLARAFGAHNVKNQGVPGTGQAPFSMSGGGLDMERAQTDPNHYLAHRSEILARLRAKEPRHE